MKVQVIKLSDNNVSYRTVVDELDGLPKEPTIGLGLLITSSTHESGGIFTSPVKKVKKLKQGWIIWTRNNKYKITIKEEE